MGYYSDLQLRVMETPMERGETVAATLKALDKADRSVCPGCPLKECKPFACPADPNYKTTTVEGE